MQRTVDSALERPGPERDARLAAALERLGHAEFRPGQREAIEGLLDARRLLLVAPTGGGKSLCYQLPALVLGGTTVVVSPLIALMRDQVDALERRGIAATFLASTLDGDELSRRLDGLERGLFQLLYVAPERLVFPRFRDILRRLDCPLFAIDEAHCISEWGHDFRPEYLEIGRVLAANPNARVLACTATATPYVRDEIVARLGLPPETPQIVRGFARPNLALRIAEVETAAQRRRVVDDTLYEALGLPGSGRGTAIVYGPTRKSTEVERDRLVADGWRCATYHAGLTGERRDEVSIAFAAGQLEIVVATNAFGMGIDRADVRAVIHLAPPGSIEAYYQEVGRAGRDGKDAIAQMLVGPGDIARRRALVDGDADGTPSSLEAAKHRWSLFLELMRFSEGGSCRHDAVLRYFGDEEETLAGCGRCDVCVRIASGESAGNVESDEEVTLIVRKALSAVARLQGRYGLSAAEALLRGADDPRLRNAGLDRTPTFGILADRSELWLTKLLRRCVTAGWVDFEGGDRPVIVLTRTGVAVMKGEREARILLPPDEAQQARSKSQGPTSRGNPFLVRKRAPGDAASAPTPKKSATNPGEILDGPALQRFESLRAHRLRVAQAEGVPSYVVASDRTLREIAESHPRNERELLRIHGIGEAKVRKYGAGFLRALEDLES
jgi:ATP-dependent DNA helicase RecQ